MRTRYEIAAPVRNTMPETQAGRCRADKSCPKINTKGTNGTNHTNNEMAIIFFGDICLES